MSTASTTFPSPHFLTVHSPHPLPATTNPTVFLAGSIDAGHAPDWQSTLTTSLQHLPITILNPRRPDWDSSWPQDDADFGPFREQVAWELDMLERADLVAMYLSPASAAPISLLELGLFARAGKLVVACPPGFWRRGNVVVVCRRFGIPVLDGLEQLREAVEERVEVLRRVEAEVEGEEREMEL